MNLTEIIQTYIDVIGSALLVGVFIGYMFTFFDRQDKIK